VEFWFSVGKEREPMMLDINRAFEARQPSVKIAWDHAPSDGALRDKLVTTSAAGSPPDVAQLNAPFVPLLVAGGALADLEALAARDRGFKLGEVFDATGLALAKKLTTDGKLYALPRGGGLLHIFYNRDAFAQQGLKDPNDLYDAKQWTWAAAVDAATKLTRRAGGGAERYGHAADFTIQRAIGIVAANGGQIFDENRKRFVFADDAASVDAVQWVVDLKDKHRVAQPVPPPDGEPTSAQTLFATGKAAMFHGLATYLAAMTPVIGSTFRYAIAPMPVGKKEATYGNAAGGMGVFKGGKRADLGWELAKHFAGTDAYVTAIKHNFIQLPMLTDKRAKEAFLASGVYGIDRVLKHAGTSAPRGRPLGTEHTAR
jgi:ABC-type glycerol-3-phosphate transport system substrate-binding protein